MTAEIVRRAEEVFDRGGFANSSVDDIARAAGISTRTLYKHVGGKGALIAAVLEGRRRRFVDSSNIRSVEDLFDHLQSWMEAEGRRGCLFMRAAGEGVDIGDSAMAIEAYRFDLIRLIGDSCARDLGADPPSALVDGVLILVEGATAAASYRGTEAVESARVIARALLDCARRTRTESDGVTSCAS